MYTWLRAFGNTETLLKILIYFKLFKYVIFFKKNIILIHFNMKNILKNNCNYWK
jgi:hypothetical protein